MTTITDTPDLENKKSENAGQTTEDIGSDIKNVTGFLSSTGKNIFWTFVYFSLGGLVLYGCKLAQSNILPADINCFPYTNKKPNIEEIFADIFFFDNASFKLKFQYKPDDIKHWNTKHFLPDKYRANKEDPNTGFFGNYFISVIEGIMSFNYTGFNIMFNLLNNAPEPFIVLAGPIIIGLSTFVLFFASMLVGVANWFYNLSWLFKTNVNPIDESDDKSKMIPVWESIKGNDWFLRLILAIFVAFALSGLSIVISVSVFAITIFSMLLYKGEYQNKPGKPVSFFSVIKDTIVYYKVFIATVVSFYMTINAFSHLGVVGGIVALFAILIVYSDMFIKLKLFVTNVPDGLTQANELTEQANRPKCKKNKPPVSTSTSESKSSPGWFMNPMSYFDSKVSHQSGGSRKLSDTQLLNEIKKLSKRVNRDIL